MMNRTVSPAGKVPSRVSVLHTTQRFRFESPKGHQFIVGNSSFPPLDRSAGCLPSLIISYNDFKPSSQIDADVMQMGC
jgi:hypothetical protein